MLHHLPTLARVTFISLTECCRIRPNCLLSTCLTVHATLVVFNLLILQSMDASVTYLEEKGVYGLVEYLLADLMLQQPAKPFEWLAERVLQLQKDNTDATTVRRQQVTAANNNRPTWCDC